MSATVRPYADHTPPDHGSPPVVDPAASDPTAVNPAAGGARSGDALIGRHLGRYRIAVKIGEGGMGVVYQGLDPQGQPVAVKVLRPHVAGDPDARRRLAREVQTLRRVRHPRVAEVLSADVDGELPYVVTRYVPGQALDDYIRSRGPLDEQALVRLGKGLGDALATIHAAGVVHRDLKPGNVLMLDGEPVVIDFGIAHVADDSRLTSTGLVMGTPGYLSPELLEGDQVTNATDWWGWAATMVFAGTGRAPFGKGPLEAVLDRVRRGAADLAGVPDSLAPTLAAALSADPAVRPRPGALRRALDAASDPAARTGTIPLGRGHGTASPPGGRPPAVQPPTVDRVTDPVPAPPVPTPDRPRRERSRWFGRDTEARPARATPAPGAAPAVGAPQVPATAALSPMNRTRVMPADPAPAPAQPPVHRPPSAGQQPPPPPWAGAPVPQPRHSSRSGTIFASFLLFVAACVAAPVLTAIIGTAWSVLARTVERSRYSVLIRRHNRGPRTGDPAAAMARSPWYLLVAVLVTAFAVLLPLVLGVSTYFATQIVVPTSTSGPVGLVPMAAGAVVAWVSAWWGPGGGNLRRGSRTVARALTPGMPGAVVAVAACLAGVVVAWYALITNGWDPAWYPFIDKPWSLLLTWARERWSFLV